MLRTEVERVAHLDRRDLKGRLVRIVLARQIAGAKRPGDLQILGIVRRDLAERRIALAELGATIGLPVLFRLSALILLRLAGIGRGKRALDLVIGGAEG